MKHIADRLEIAQGNNNVDELIPEAIAMLRQQQADLEHMWMANTVLEAEIEALKANSARYEWLRTEFAHGRETYLAEGMPSGESLDKYIDEQLRKAQEK